MTSLDEIELAVSKLSADDFARLRDWIIEQDDKAWDIQIDQDATSGKLDFLMQETKGSDLKPLDDRLRGA